MLEYGNNLFLYMSALHHSNHNLIKTQLHCSNSTKAHSTTIKRHHQSRHHLRSRRNIQSSPFFFSELQVKFSRDIADISLAEKRYHRNTTTRSLAMFISTNMSNKNRRPIVHKRRWPRVGVGISNRVFVIFRISFILRSCLIFLFYFNFTPDCYFISAFQFRVFTNFSP